MALNYVTVTGTFDDGSGTPLPGVGGKAYCQFTPNQAVYASGVPLITPAQPIQASINNGSMSVQLLATDNTGLTFGGLTGFFYWTVTLVLNGQNQPSWSFFLPHTPSPVDLSALINTAAGGGGGTSLPLTTLGDLLYENATPAAARLPGNTTAVRQFLTQTGTGTVSAAPAWAAIAAGDVPGFDGVTVTGTPSSGQVPTATGGTAATWQAPGVAYQPWQFQPETYGAKGDGKIATDAATTLGSATITSASAGFTNADTGKWMMVNGGNGTAAAPLIGTITFVNSTTVTLSVTAGVTASNCAAVYGTNDTAAINSAISAAQTYAQANNYMAEVLFKDRIYVSATRTQETVPATYNAEILIPFPNANGTTRKLMLTLRGAGYMAPAQYWESVAPNVQGSAIVSMQTAPSTPDVTFGVQSVIGGPTGGTLTGGFANTHLTVEDLSVWCPAYTNIKALYMQLLSGTHLAGYSSNIFAPANNSSAAPAAHPYLADFPAQSIFQNSIGVGIWFPQNLNNDALSFGDIVVEGYEVCVFPGEHLTGDRLAALYGDVILKIDGGGSNHEVAIRSVSAEVYNGGILVIGAGGHSNRLNIGWDSETVGNPIYDISDSGNNAYGRVYWYDNGRAAPIVTGAANLKIVNERLGPGAWSGQPAVPATTVAQQNTSWRDAAVSIKGGTVTVVAVDGVTVATATNTTVIVPAGKNITLTYSGAPTWAWTLL